jgi:hypothetical protein
MSSLL